MEQNNGVDVEHMGEVVDGMVPALFGYLLLYEVRTTHSHETSPYPFKYDVFTLTAFWGENYLQLVIQEPFVGCPPYHFLVLVCVEFWRQLY